MASKTEASGSQGLLDKVGSHPETIQRVAKYFFVFWGVCVVAGVVVAVGLANASSKMKPQDAFNSGLVIALLPVVATAIIVVGLWVLSWFVEF